MSTVVKFLIIYLVPVISFSGIIGSYMLVYGDSVDHPIISLVLLFVISGFLVSSYLSVKLVSQFSGEKLIYSGIFFTVLGWLLGGVPVIICLMLFKGLFNP
ncbi:hypothetical protein ACFFUS_22195 [Vibrio gallaecicus]|uniref:hypothetical protein n=1 Tax=Vibrio gallaecicus TaxID=552386 RepID=UPI0010C9BBB3|nr:hypothetical protein [Vibrio gallaecicus]